MYTITPMEDIRIFNFLVDPLTGCTVPSNFSLTMSVIYCKLLRNLFVPIQEFFDYRMTLNLKKKKPIITSF